LLILQLELERLFSLFIRFSISSSFIHFTRRKEEEERRELKDRRRKVFERWGEARLR
jgi:hypothetical protein